MGSKRKPNLIKTDRGKEFYNIIFQSFLNNNNIKLYFRNTSLGAVFADRFNRTIRDFCKRPVFERGKSNWIDVIPKITKKYNKRVHLSKKLTPVEASLKKNESCIYQKLLDKRKKIKPKIQVNDLDQVAVFKRTLSKGDTTNWSYKLYINTENFNDTIPSYHIDNLPERYNEALLKKTELRLEENKNVMKKLNLN